MKTVFGDGWATLSSGALTETDCGALAAVKTRLGGLTAS